MPVQAPQWTEFLLCPICTQTFEENARKPISLGCGHTVCKMCLNKLHRKACPFDQTTISTDIELLPVNTALLQLVCGQVPKSQPVTLVRGAEDTKHYDEARTCVEELALYLKPLSNTRGVGLGSATQSLLSRPMQRKLVTLVHCQLVEEEGRIRAMRAARSLGERTVTELILQHQNPQQLSSNLWAAVRARGCQFLGPAMQEEALKLVLLALEDGSALSRKVLVLFVVQRLEPRFPQASKTSIGHVVQLLYRASCFKVTKRDEDSSLMQLKEEFRTYEALRREHDSQIVQIAMEGGLRIAPDQWSSLLYGDQSHKSHMQSIIDKLQTPASFAQSVQELTIALQRTGDPANLNRLRPHLELLADIDPSPDAPAPTWEQLDKGLVAVKTVVHGLVDFIQNHSKKGGDPQQAPQHSKYKTYMCRDMKQKGGCPRGASCTFAHSQEELEKYRKMNKRLPTRKTLSQSLTQLNDMDMVCPSNLLPDEGLGVEGLVHKPGLVTNGIIHVGPGSGLLISRGADPSYEPVRKLGKPESGGSLSAPDSPPDSLDPMPKVMLPAPPHPRGSRESLASHKHLSTASRIAQIPQYPPHQLEGYYSDSRPPHSASQYEPSQYPAGNSYNYSHMHRYARNPGPPADPAYPDSYPLSYASERQYATPPSDPRYSYPPHHDGGRRHPAYGGHLPPQSYTRDELGHRSPGPMDAPPPPQPQTAGASAYLPESSRDRYNAQIYNHHGQSRSHSRAAYPRPQPSLDDLHRRRKEIMAQLEEVKVVSPPPFGSSSNLAPPYEPSYSQEARGQSHYMEENSTAFESFREPDYAAQYSPWSCGTFVPYIGKDMKSKEGMAAGYMEMQNVEKSLRDPALELQRRAPEVKDDDPIIPFGSLPTVSRFGAISRTSKSGYQPAGLMPGHPAKHTASAVDYNYGNHGGWSEASYPQHQTMPSQGYFSERLPPAGPDREQLRMELQQVNQQITQQTRSIESSSSVVAMQREPVSMAGQSAPVEWSTAGVSSEQLSLELHQVEREIGMRTREMALEGHGMKYRCENGQSDHGMQREEHQLALSEGSNGSSSVVQDCGLGSSSMSSLTSKTSSLSLSSDLVASSPDLSKNGVVHTCS
ncbi:roquin-1a isoform X1 [Astyanax mexicanus]|uniref:roquin-1a isoform X1 n=1 Tax=Astyanax mexicanus TaxID=7994 RepID=UPI0020CAF5E8|nr:roquin-1a isoform X1 [Astyanax mexicanus]XP_007240176.3 roquin-1a isoform X1 [Astyanax mexicanus]